MLIFRGKRHLVCDVWGGTFHLPKKTRNRQAETLNRQPFFCQRPKIIGNPDRADHPPVGVSVGLLFNVCLPEKGGVLMGYGV